MSLPWNGAVTVPVGRHGPTDAFLAALVRGVHESLFPMSYHYQSNGNDVVYNTVALIFIRTICYGILVSVVLVALL